MNPDYDSDWPSPEELQAMTPRDTPRDRRRDVLLFCIVYVLLVLMAILNGGCATDPATGDLTVRVPAAAADAATNAAARAVVVLREARERREAESASAGDGDAGGGDAPGGGGGTVHPEPASGSTVSSPALVWRFGGFDGSRAAEDSATQIRDFRMDSRGMSYAWAKGDLSNWGLAGDDAGALACAFYRDPATGRWVGGKFDWISTSRTTRSWENVKGGYNGWSAPAFFAAGKHAFCIVSRDGRRRTNLVTD